MLQWGHVVVDVEGKGLRLSRTRAQCPASMGPRRRRRGRSCPATGGPGLDSVGFNGATSSSTWKGNSKPRALQWTSCFNGATSSSTWKEPQTENVAREPSQASMGPRRRRRGRREFVSLRMLKLTWLQWGHVVVDVEGLLPPPPRSASTLASMGPRRRRRGRSTSRCGATSTSAPLQWGHVVVDVEGARRRQDPPLSASPGFNGATSSSTWKEHPQIPPQTPPRLGFNGATSSSTWKALGVLLVEVLLRLASMGPRRRLSVAAENRSVLTVSA